MAVQIIHQNYTPDWGGKELLLRAAGDDPGGGIFGGTLGVFDFAQPDYPDESVVGTEFYNLRTGADPMVGNSQNGAGNARIVDINATKGVHLVSGNGDRVNFPDSFDLLNMGSEPSALFWAWVTNNETGTDPSGTSSIMGYGAYNGSSCQYTVVINSGKVEFRIGSNGGASFVTAPSAYKGDTFLVSLYIEKTGAGVFSAKCYVDDTLIGTISRSYPFNNPVTAYSESTPRIGLIQGYSSAWDLTIHRTGGRQVNPDYFDFDEWRAAEIAANTGRW